MCLKLFQYCTALKYDKNYATVAWRQSRPPLLSLFHVLICFFRYHCRSNVAQVRKCMHTLKFICLKISQTHKKNTMDTRYMFISPLHHFFHGATAPRGPGSHYRGLMITLSKGTSHSVGLPWLSDQHDSQNNTQQRTTLKRNRCPCHRRNSNPQSQEASCFTHTP